MSLNIIKTDEINHFKSMRVKVDEIISATDLKGTKAKIKILEINKNYSELKFEVLVLNNSHINNTVIPGSIRNPLTDESTITTTENSKPSKTIFQAITDKTYLEKLCEIAPLAGIATINLFFSDRSIKQNVQIERLNKILIRACEQSETLFLPELKVIEKKELTKIMKESKPCVLACYLNEVGDEQTPRQTSSATPQEGNFKTSLVSDSTKYPVQPNVILKSFQNPLLDEDKLIIKTKPKNNNCLVGPEGGWSERELQEFQRLELEFVSIGTTVFPAWLAGFRYFVG